MAEAGKREVDFADRNETDTVKAKRLKNDPNSDQDSHNESASANPLFGFKTTTVLRDSAREKNMFIHGKVANVTAI